MPAAASSQTVPAGARDREVRRSERRAEVVRRLEEDVVAARHAWPHGVVVARAGHVEDCRPALPERLDRELVQRLRSRQPAEDGEHGPMLREPEAGSRLVSLGSEMRRGDRAPDDAVLRAVPALDRVREEDASRERRGEPVREPEVRVGLGERGRNPA